MGSLKLHNTVIAALLLLACLVSSGCLDAPVNAPYGSVQGTLSDTRGFPLGSCWIKMNSNWYLTNSSGSFYFEYIVGPYSASIEASDASGDYIISYDMMNSGKFNPVIQDAYGSSRSINLTVVSPPTEENRRIFTKFISAETFTQDFYTSPAHDTVYTGINLPTNKTSISGKFVFLECTLNGNAFTFNKFGSKNITISRGTINSISFSDSELTQNIPARDVSYNVTLPPGNYASNIAAAISFAGFSGNSDLQIYGRNNSLSGTFRMPDLPGFNTNVKITSGLYTAQKWVHIPTGGSASIVYDVPLTLSSPPNNQENVTDATEFAINENSPKGIYAFTIFTNSGENSNNRFLFVTLKKNFKFGDIRPSFYPYLNFASHWFGWYVTKYPDFNTLEDFVSSPLPDNPAYTSKYTSGVQYFKTAP